MISKAKRERFDLGLAMFKIGHDAGRQTAAADAGNVDCQMCGNDDARKLLGFSCNEWRGFCGPQGIDCPVISCGDPDAS